MIQTSQGLLIARDRPVKMHEVVVPINLNLMRAAVINPKNNHVEQEFKLNSYVENFIRIIWASMGGTTINLPNILGNNSSCSLRDLSMGGATVTATNRRGILFGSSADAGDITHTTLPGRFTSDVVYSTTTFNRYPNRATVRHYDVLRTITSGIDHLAINELGMAGKVNHYNPPILLSRDVLPTTVTLMNTEKRTFRIRCSFPLEMGLAFSITFYAAASITTDHALDIENESRAVGRSINNSADENVIIRGIRISSSDVAVAWDDYTIEDLYPITDFYHAKQVYTGRVISGSNGSITVSREFFNISNPPVAKTVKKFGLFQRGGSYTHLSHAALLPAEIIVQPEGGLRIIYKFSINH